MATETEKKKQQTKPSAEDLESIKSDIKSFASSLGFSPGAAAGFDDSDFRKSGRIKPNQHTITSDDDDVDHIPNATDPDATTTRQKPKLKSHPLSIDLFTNPSNKSSSRQAIMKLPLMNPSSLSAQWYADAEELEKKVVGAGGRGKATTLEELKKMAEEKRCLAEQLMQQYVKEYESTRRKNSDMRLLEVTARSGTSADKVSAFTCLVEDNPIANMRSLDALVSMVTSKVGKRYAFTGFEALKELFLLRLLPDRKLKNLIQRPLDILPESKDGYSLLLFWYWEDCLKQRYERFVIALEEALKDMLPNLKDKAMKTVCALLKAKPEQERRLLTALVNKLGDPERKAASNAGYNLSCLLSAHPNMKAVVIDEVDSFIFRPHVGLRAKYQAVNFLSQMLLSKKGDGPRIAKRLVEVYFALFKVLIMGSNDGKKVHQPSIKYRKGSDKSKVKGTRNKKKTSSFQNAEEDIESNVEMDSRLLSALLTGVNRAFPFVASDEADDILDVQTPILYKLVHSENFNVCVQALMLLYQISSKNQIASDRFYRALYSKFLTPAAVNSSKPEMFLGLLAKAMKNDINLKRVSAFTKRLLQVALQRPAQYACGCLFLLSEILKAKPPLWTMVLQNESVDDELEHFEDIKEEAENVLANSTSQMSSNGCDVEVEDDFDEGTQSLEVGKEGPEHDQTVQKDSSLPGGYNPRHREPSYCNADRTAWWELSMLAAHVHPSVATMAQTLLSGANIVYNGDPLNDLSLNAFLDKFMEKKPKANRKVDGKWHGGSQIAPAKKLDMNHHLIGEEILQLAEEEVPPEDVVFHRFYMNKTSSSKKPKAKKKMATEDEENTEDLLADASDESEEEEIDNMLGSVPITSEETKGDYDYDDLDGVIDDDDNDLIGNGSDADAEPPTGSYENNHGGESSSDAGEDGSTDIWDYDISESGGDDDDGVEVEEVKAKRSKKRKLKGSPFASLEEYEHLINGDNNEPKKSRSQKKPKKRRSDRVNVS